MFSLMPFMFLSTYCYYYIYSPNGQHPTDDEQADNNETSRHLYDGEAFIHTTHWYCIIQLYGLLTKSTAAKAMWWWLEASQLTDTISYFDKNKHASISYWSPANIYVWYPPTDLLWYAYVWYPLRVDNLLLDIYTLYFTVFPSHLTMLQNLFHMFLFWM